MPPQRIGSPSPLLYNSRRPSDRSAYLSDRRRINRLSRDNRQSPAQQQEGGQTTDRWYDDNTTDRKYAEDAIKAGVLQTIASQFVGQTLQERAGETEMRDGINQVIVAVAWSNCAEGGAKILICRFDNSPR